MTDRMQLTAIVWAISATLGCALGAQSDLLVTSAPFSPADQGLKAGTTLVVPLACFRCAASNGDVTVNGLQLTPGGSGDWVNDLDPTNGVEVWLDNGDGTFNASSDTLLGLSAGATPTIGITFSPSEQILSGSASDVWVVLNLLAGAGNSIPDTFSIGIAAPNDVAVSGSVNITFGTPVPTSALLSVVDFYVTAVTPTTGWMTDVVTITGSGFTPPLSVQVGTQSAGVGVNAARTELYVTMPPPSSGGPHTITLDTSLLPPEVLTQTFTYVNDGQLGGVGDDKEGSCSTNEAHELSLLAIVTGTLSLLGLSRVIRTRA
ncbi:MAG: hypothetical protein IPK87_05500 [Planctomycetes bacterium]|nr:hypothetical protein [Planctomycetota bacterium]